MSCHIKGQRYSDAYHLCYAFQVVVDVVSGIAVDASLVAAGVTDDGEQVIALVFRVFVHYLLHLFCPCDDELLTRLAAAVGDVAVFQVTFPEECHVDETHAAQVEAHKKHIAGEVQCR